MGSPASFIDIPPPCRLESAKRDHLETINNAIRKIKEVVVATQGGNSTVGERESSTLDIKRTPLGLHNPLVSDPHNYSRVGARRINSRRA